MRNFVRMGVKLLGFIFFLSIQYGVSQTTGVQKLDTLELRSLYKNTFNKQLNDTIRLRSARRFFDRLGPYSSQDIERNKIAKEYEDVVLYIFSKYFYRYEHDSLLHYKSMFMRRDHVIGNGDANFVFAKYLLRVGNYDESIQTYQKALASYKSAENLVKTIVCYIKLGEVYNYIGSEPLSHEIDSILTHQYLNNPKTPPNLKGRIKIHKAVYKALAGKQDESLQILKEIHPEKSFDKDSYLNLFYYLEVAKRYIEKGNKDSAITYIDKAYSNPKLYYVYNKVKERVLKAEIYYASKEYEKSLALLQEAEKDPGFTWIENPDLVIFFKLKYLLCKQLGQSEKALHYHEKYIELKTKLKNIGTNISATILNAKLKHKKEIKRIKEQALIKEQHYTEKKRIHIIYIVVFGITFFLFVGILYYLKQKRQKQRLRLEYQNMKEVYEMKNRFIENISHELSTPITILLGYLKLIQLNTLNQDVLLKHLASVKRNAKLISDNFDQFLTLLKLEKGTLNRPYQKKYIREFLEERVAAFGVIGALKKIKIYYISNIHSKRVFEYDYDSLSKILNNLISNALKYSNSNSSIYVDTMIKNGSLYIAVRDEGIGISRDDLSNIFNRFYQSNETNNQGGFGIGLSLVQDLTTELNGTIEVDSQVDVGSVFQVILPIDIGADYLFTAKEDVNYVLINDTLNKNSQEEQFPKVLIVDDHIEMTNYIQELLQKQYHCSVAFNGKEALELIAENSYELIISDLAMPIMDGLQLKKALDQMEDKSTTPFIIMTSSSKEYVEHHELIDSQQYSDFIIKPFTENELLVRINRLVEGNVHTKSTLVEQNNINYQSIDSAFIQKACKIILENMHNSEFTVQELAQKVGYSNKQLTKIIKEKTGLSPVQLILDYRLLKSYDLIMNKSYATIKEVIFAVGLSSRAYFNKAFTNRFGIKPTELMNSTKKQSSL